MKYMSTRNKSEKVSASFAIKEGLSKEGGLYVPEEFPELTTADYDYLKTVDYKKRAAYILNKYLVDFSIEELEEFANKAYGNGKFPENTTPLYKYDDDTYYLELWHGPTAAFKDMALQIMPRLLSRALVKTGETRDALILVATSGDTGKAALEGYKDIDRIKIMVFYPVDGVSRVQKLQMATQTGDNVNVCAIRGNFDDAQTGVKKIFGDADMAAQLNERGFVLSSANSINWGRLAPQIVYYVSAYCDLVNAGNLALGETMDVCVPTGNFGNIFAGYIAKLMGLPIRHFVCASNKNNILTDFLRTGTYDRNRAFHLTMSPSMDILISSNLERLLCFSAGEERTASYMEQLKMTGAYTVDADVLSEITANFSGYFADEQATAATIKSYFEHDHYLADTHTAVALSCAEQYLSTLSAEELRPIVVDSTASPYKFAADVYESLGKSQPADPLAALDELSIATGTEIPYPLCGLGERTVRFTTVIDADDMPAAVLDYCN